MYIATNNKVMFSEQSVSEGIIGDHSKVLPTPQIKQQSGAGGGHSVTGKLSLLQHRVPMLLEYDVSPELNPIPTGIIPWSEQLLIKSCILSPAVSADQAKEWL